MPHGWHRRRALLLGLCPLGLTACAAVGPDYVRPDMAVSPDWLSPVSQEAPDAHWWRSLDDPALSALVDLAVTNNLDLREAEARLREARANRDAARGRTLPAVDAIASATKNRLSENGQLPVDRIPGFDPSFSLFDLGFDASWEIDIWGRTRRAVEGAEARAQAADAARRGVALSVIAEVVRSYIDLRAAQARRASVALDAKAQAEIAALVGQRFRVGEASRFDHVRADAQAQATAAQLEILDADARAAAYRIALLIGRPPEAIPAALLAPGDLPKAPARIAAGLRSDLLRRRPDIGQAERELAAFTADIGVATADLFPRFTLLGSVGQQARDSGDLTAGGSTRYQLGPSLHWPIFSAGRIRAQVHAANARADAALARYERAVLGALADSETALNRFAAAQAARRRSDAARDQAAVALELARQRYRAGADDLIVLLNAQSAFTAADRQSLDARAAELAAFVAACKALGGGWEAGAL